MDRETKKKIERYDFNFTTIMINKRTKKFLQQFRKEKESWNAFLIRVGRIMYNIRLKQIDDVRQRREQAEKVAATS